jgi:hypothetical protein
VSFRERELLHATSGRLRLDDVERAAAALVWLAALRDPPGPR